MTIDPDFSAALEAARQERRFVRIECEAFESEFSGIVQALGEELVAVALLDDRVRMGGVDILRLASISDVELPAPHADFYETALRLRGEVVPSPDDVDLSGWRGVLETVSGIAPLVVIHREEVEAEVCEVGQLLSLGSEDFELREIDPDADWYEEHTRIPYSELTRVGYGGDYEAALALVAGIVS